MGWAVGYNTSPMLSKKEEPEMIRRFTNQLAVIQAERQLSIAISHGVGNFLGLAAWLTFMVLGGPFWTLTATALGTFGFIVNAFWVLFNKPTVFEVKQELAWLTHLHEERLALEESK